MTTLDELAGLLRARGFADPAYLLNRADRERLAETIDRQRERGLNAYVVRAEPGRPLGELRALWTTLGLDEQRDLLLLYNGTRWEAKGWGLSAAQIGATLDAAEPALQRNQVEGLVGALDELGELVPTPRFPWLPVSAAALGLVGLGWVIARRRKLRGQRNKRIATALASAEAAQADVVLAAEALPGQEAAEVQLRAATLGEGLQRAAQGENDAVAVGRLEQLESELNALYSEVLARTRRGQGG
jgi:hypothetical protein